MRNRVIQLLIAILLGAIIYACDTQTPVPTPTTITTNSPIPTAIYTLTPSYILVQSSTQTPTLEPGPTTASSKDNQVRKEKIGIRILDCPDSSCDLVEGEGTFFTNHYFDVLSKSEDGNWYCIEDGDVKGWVSVDDVVVRRGGKITAPVGDCMASPTEEPTP